MSTLVDEELRSELDTSLTALAARAEVWSALALREKRRLLEGVIAGVADVAAEWVARCCAAKGIPAGSQLEGEEWIVGPWAVLSYTHALAETVQAVEEGRDPLAGFSARQVRDRAVLRVFPHGVFERLLLHGYGADVWFERGVSIDEGRERQAGALRAPDGGGTAVVLGAGNVSSIGPLDALYKLFAANRVVALKLNPLTDYLAPVLERALAPLVGEGFLRIIQGDAAVGGHLVRSEQVAEVHMTGNARTHDAIVWGSDGEQSARKAARAPLLSKPITSELGGISPAIVLPGRWSEADLRFQAEHLATQRLHNGGCNCIATQVVVLPDRWQQKDAFRAHLRRALASAPGRPAYYPGAEERRRSALESYPRAQRLGEQSTLLLDGLQAGDRETAFSTEYFSPVIGITELGSPDLDTYLRDCVEFANERLQGTLGAGLIAHPSTLAELGSSLDGAIADLAYGTVAVNCWLGVGYLIARATWGAFPGHETADVQSGIGVVHNALLLDGVERSVVRGPFRPFPRSLLQGERSLSPTPPWFVNNRTAATTARRLTEFAASPGWTKLPAVFASALRG